jgi:hypothetical protein
MIAIPCGQGSDEPAILALLTAHLALRAKHPAPLHPAPRKSPSTPKLWSMLVECAAEKQEHRDEDGDPKNADREAKAEAEAHRKPYGVQVAHHPHCRRGR